MYIYRSRFTPGLKNGAEVSFNIGEVVTYCTHDGKKIKVTIDSDIMKHDQAPGDKTGYECIFHDDGGRYFAYRGNIIDWEGKQ